MEAVAVTLQPRSLHVTLQPSHLALCPLCSYWSSCCLQRQFWWLLLCSVMVTISSANTSLHHLHFFTYFLSFIFFLWYHECYHLCFINTVEYLCCENCHCLHSFLVFTFFYCLWIFTIFYAPLLLFSFDVCIFLIIFTIFDLIYFFSLLMQSVCISFLFISLLAFDMHYLHYSY